MKKKEYSVEIGGKTMTALFTDLAEQAGGSVILKYGETIVLATACMSRDRQEGLGFFNLTVDYAEKFYAAGKILGSRFVRREGKPSQEAVLACRVIDRTLRPLFDQSIRHAVQVIVTVLSVDENDPTILAVNAASLALAVSDIPWNGPVGCVRIGIYDDGILKVNPKQELRLLENAHYKFDLTVCGKDGNVNMIEAAARQADEAEIEEALATASVEISKLETFQKNIVAEIGKAKRVIEKEKISQESLTLFNQEILPHMETALFAGSGKAKIDELHSKWNKLVREKFPEQKSFSSEDDLFDDTENDILHTKAIEEDRRADGRAMDEVRELYAQAGGLSSKLHGSGIFYRGGTHVLSVLTLGGPEARYTVDGLQQKEERRFMHHYNFPPYSAGEVGRAGFTNRREVGHGALAEKALAMVLPPVDQFPYTIRLVSESMASNGSTSQASICASTLALMDGGVPILAPVAGIAMGLMFREAKYKILTDIQGPEDHHGDMDFKIAGSRQGITAIQLDVKVDGVSVRILGEAMRQAKKARTTILDAIEQELPAPRAAISPNAPEIIVSKINPDKIGLVIGSGGKTIKDIMEKSGAEITIDDDGTIYFTGKSGAAEKARAIVEEMTHEFQIGETLKGEVVKIADFGAFVRLNPFTDGMVHISELAPFRVDRVASVLKEGMIVPVKIKGVDPERGKISLSIKDADPNFFKPHESA